MKPDELIDCPHLGAGGGLCRLPARACVERQLARAWNPYTNKPTRKPEFLPCGTGNCEKGAEVAEELRRDAPDWTPRPYRRDKPAREQAKQRAAGRRKVRGQPRPRKERKKMPEKCAGGCGKDLRASSQGGHCYDCRVELGLVERPPWQAQRERERTGQALPRTLPDPSILPHDYLVRCVKEANRRRSELDDGGRAA